MKIKLALICMMLATSANAEEIYVNEMKCGSTDEVFQSLKKEYGEIPVVLGKSDDVAKSTMTVWTNPQTNSWSIIATKDELSCIVGTGSSLKVIPYGKKV